ncbi:hypothetical protein [Staphylococcus haemolyticus]|uniref:hypothetical protein n=1 Tax=Staphylococcus haemolyticus TaxID=1283 RepID=UPI00069D8777|nr:hypothetical protein [Staphylococcus haemolyticus]
MYSRDDILQGINNYSWWCNAIASHCPDYSSNSIAQYGIEATMPKAEGENSSKVEQTVIRLDKFNSHYAKMLGIINVINTHQPKLDTLNYVLLDYLKRGETSKVICDELPIHKNYLKDRKIDLAEQIFLMQ